MNTETEKTAKTGSVKTPERSSSGKSGSEHRIVEQPGFVLHSYVYKESTNRCSVDNYLEEHPAPCDVAV